jgi:hypothetical protein
MGCWKKPTEVPAQVAPPPECHTPVRLTVLTVSLAAPPSALARRLSRLSVSLLQRSRLPCRGRVRWRRDRRLSWNWRVRLGWVRGLDLVRRLDRLLRHHRVRGLDLVRRLDRLLGHHGVLRLNRLLGHHGVLRLNRLLRGWNLLLSGRGLVVVGAFHRILEATQSLADGGPSVG